MPLFPAPPTTNPPRVHFKRYPLIFSIGGGGSVLTAGVKGYNQIYIPGRIKGWSISSKQSGDLVLDVVKGAGPTPPTTSIVGVTAPELSSAQFAESEDLTDWDIDFKEGDLIGWEIISVSVITQFTFQLHVF